MELPRPAPPAGRAVLVRMARAPINPADILATEGRYAFALAEDAPLGAEGVGIVEAIGPDVEAVEVGDAVLPLSRGNWCRFRLLEENDVIVLPGGLALDQAAMLRVNPLTARLVLASSGVRPGDTIVQNAASSAVARWVRFFAARQDVAVIDVVRRADSELPLAIVDGPDLAQQVLATTFSRPVQAALDCVAGEATGRLAACLAPGSRLVVFGHLSGAPMSVRSQLMTAGGLSIVGFSLRSAEAMLGPEGVQQMFAQLFALIGDELPRSPIKAIYPLSEIADALAATKAAGGGRVLLDLTA